MNVREVTKKIKSVGNVKKITKAMQMVSAVKMRKAQTEATNGQPYQYAIEDAIRRVSTKIDTSFSDLLTTHVSAKKSLAIVITTNKGLCGSFNTTLLRHMIKGLDLKNTDFITIGKKGSVFLSLVKGNIVADFSLNKPLSEVPAVFDLALKSFATGEYKEVLVIYNKFINTLRYEPQHDVLLPLKLDLTQVKEDVKQTEYMIEPSPQSIIHELLKSYVEQKIRYAVIQSEAGEHSARMIAMKNATDNASEVILSLTSLKNKLRQQKITYELLDMVTAKESVEVS